MMVSFELTESIARTLATSSHPERLISDKVIILLGSKYGWAEDEIEYVREDDGFQEAVNREWRRHAQTIRYGGRLPKSLSVDCPVPASRMNRAGWGRTGRNAPRTSGRA